MVLLERGPEGVHTLDHQVGSRQDVERIEAAGGYWTSCLNSDISALRNRHSIVIVSRSDPYISPRGFKANFSRYWLADAKACRDLVKLVNLLRRRRNDQPLSQRQVARYIARMGKGAAA
ncbi:hypothetical protein [Ferrimonas sp.]|uniref:hypothetical protein n=1 Tax=Ferrimonas sp. TaxID=2080861 RepID=UPI003A8CE764